ncbi:MAG: class II glutamine amidotransferase [Elusimicrobiales bacterium]
MIPAAAALLLLFNFNAEACRMMALFAPDGADAVGPQLILGALSTSPRSLKDQSRKGEKKRYSDIYTLEDLDKAYETYGNPDGWGVVFYAGDQTPHEARSAGPAYADKFYDETVDKLSRGKAEIVLAHVRLASDRSTVSEANTHPFVHGNWSFMHNGSIDLRDCVPINNKLAGFKEKYGLAPKGPVDSEQAFYYFLGKLEEKKQALKALTDEEIIRTFAETVKDLKTGARRSTRAFIAANPMYPGKILSSPVMNFIATNGELILVYKNGHELYLGRVKTKDGAKPYYLIASDILQPLKDRHIEWFEIPQNYILTIKKSTQELNLMPLED